MAPTVALSNTTTSLAEDTDTTAAIKVADITITDDGLGTNTLSLSGADAGDFEIVGTALYLKAGTTLNATDNASLDVTVDVDDATLGTNPDDSDALAITVTPVNAAPTLANAIPTRAPPRIQRSASPFPPTPLRTSMLTP